MRWVAISRLCASLAEDPACVSIREYLAGFHQVVLDLGLEEVREPHSLGEVLGHRRTTESPQLILQVECWVGHRRIKLAENLSE